MPVHEKILADESRMKTAKGKRALLKFASGLPLTPMEGIRAKCYECQAYYEDVSSERDCRVRSCPLYPFNPYSNDKSQNMPSVRMKERMEAEGGERFGFAKQTPSECGLLPDSQEFEEPDEEETEEEPIQKGEFENGCQ